MAMLHREYLVGRYGELVPGHKKCGYSEKTVFQQRLSGQQGEQRSPYEDAISHVSDYGY